MGGGADAGTLYEVLKRRRNDVISRWGQRVTNALNGTNLPRAEMFDHMPAFVDEIVQALYPEAVSLPAVSAHAEEHGEQRLRLGFDVAEVVPNMARFTSASWRLPGMRG